MRLCLRRGLRWGKPDGLMSLTKNGLCLRRPDLLCSAKEIGERKAAGVFPRAPQKGILRRTGRWCLPQCFPRAGPIGTRSVPGPTGCTAISPCRLLACGIFAKAVPPADSHPERVLYKCLRSRRISSLYVETTKWMSGCRASSRPCSPFFIQPFFGDQRKVGRRRQRRIFNEVH